MLISLLQEGHKQVFFNKLLLCQTFLLGVNQMHVVVSLGVVLPSEQYFDFMILHEQKYVCWPPVGRQDIEHNYKTKHTLSQ